MAEDDRESDALARLRNQLERERRIRIEAETIAEQSTRELYSRQQELTLLERIAVAANQATSLEAALQIALDEVCAHTGWPVGHAWLRAAEPPGDLVSTGIWHLDDSSRFAVFRKLSEATSFAPGIGLPGRVLASGHPAWIVDVHLDVNFPRARQAADIGVRAGFAFPVLIGAEAVGVLEFFSEEQRSPDQRLLEIMEHVGSQLGRVLERGRAVQSVAAARDAAQASERMKGEFLASMSHEVRTPLNAVIGMTGLLLDTKLTPEQSEYAEAVRSSADALLQLVNDILDFSKIEAGKLSIEPIPFDLQVAVEEVAELLAPRAAEKGVDLTVRYAPGAHRRFVGDPGRIRQVVTNLVGNAIKFTDKGHILVEVQCQKPADAKAVVQLTVADTGIGIPLEKQARLFEKFIQADASTTRKYGGTGLGLAISKQLVELMGGEVGVRSREGEGAAFWFKLPLPTDEQPMPVRDVAPLAGLRVLVVDDNEVNRRILREQLTQWGIDVSCVASGEEALRTMREACVDGRPFQLALLDLHMPEMDGRILARAIKEDRALKDTILLLLTSAGQRGDAKRMSEAGFAAYLMKPVRASLLMDALATAWASRHLRTEPTLITRHSLAEQRAAETSLEAPGTLRQRVLLVEDNIVNQKVARLMLEKLGCRVDTAASGSEAVDLFERLPYDLVFMDCQMPEMDGYEATRAIRRSERGGRYVPIVALTAHAMEGDRERCLEAGMDDYMTKPIRREALRSALERWVSSKREAPEARRAEAAPAPAVAAALSPEFCANLRSWREESGDAAVHHLVTIFLGTTRDHIASLRAALETRDFAQAELLAHGLRGSSATFGATGLARITQELEAAVKSRTEGECSSLIGQLEESFRAFEAAAVSEGY